MRYSAECWVLSSEFKKWRVLPLSKLSTQDSALRTALLLIIALFAGPAQAATYYLDPDFAGSTTDGSAAHPWTTLSSTEWGTLNNALGSQNVTIYFSARK